jgi:hypothetical protein
VSLSFGSDSAFFDPRGDRVAADAERALEAPGARAFLVRVEDALLVGLGIAAFSGVFAVLFAALIAAVALPVVVGVAVAFELVALAVRAGQGDRDGHESILHQTITAIHSLLQKASPDAKTFLGEMLFWINKFFVEKGRIQLGDDSRAFSYAVNNLAK